MSPAAGELGSLQRSGGPDTRRIAYPLDAPESRHKIRDRDRDSDTER